MNWRQRSLRPRGLSPSTNANIPSLPPTLSIGPSRRSSLLDLPPKITPDSQRQKQESIRVARNEIKVEQQRLTSKYNFDFENDAPLPGEYKYEKIDRSTEAIESRLHEVLLVAEKENLNVGTSNSGGTQRSITDFYIVSRKRSCPPESPKVAKAMNASTSTTTTLPDSESRRLTLTEICE